MLTSPVGISQDRQEGFFFVVPLQMEGRWRMLAEAEKFDPDWSVTIDFEGDTATVTQCQPSDGGTHIAKRAGTFRCDGGRLIIDFLDEAETGDNDRIEGAALVDRDVIAVVHTLWHDDKPDEIRRRSYTLVREELADALRSAGATWSGETLAKIQ